MTDDTSHADAELIRRCAEGDEGAWVTFVDRYGPRLTALARRMLARRGGPADDASVDEVVADVFLALLRRDRLLLRRYDPTWRVMTYLGVLCRTEVSRLLRRRRRMLTPFDAGEGPPAPGPVPDAAVEAQEELRRRVGRLRQALASLSARDRLLLELKYLEGLDYRAIAAALGVGEASVGRLLTRARRRLAKLAPDLDAT